MRFLFILSVALSACTVRPTKPAPPIQYQLVGKGPVTLVFVHGWCINQTYWAAQVEAFKNRYQVLTLDLAGHGQSKITRTDWSIESYANDVAQLVEHLDLKNVVLIGHSMSGNVNLRVLDKIPERVIGFVGIDNFQNIGEEVPPELKAQIQEFYKMLKSDYAATVKNFSGAQLFSPSTDSSVIKRVMNDILKADPAMSVPTLESLGLETAVERQLAPKMKIPLCLVNSDVNPVNEEALKKYCGASYRIRYIKGSGHYPMVEQPEEFNKALLETVEEIAK
jgi:sigma-B regulation protein RsbQ